jgi:hypothetical protein
MACGMSMHINPLLQALPCALKEFNRAAFELSFHE